MDTIKAYIALTKPRIIELLLVAAIPAMLQAQRGIEAAADNIWLIVSTIFGGWMGAAAAHTFNNVVEYELDQKMQRTRARPLVRGKISRKNAAVFAFIMLALSYYLYQSRSAVKRFVLTSECSLFQTAIQSSPRSIPARTTWSIH